MNRFSTKEVVASLFVAGCCGMLFSPSLVHAQEASVAQGQKKGTVTGVVKDAQGNPVIGAGVTVKGTKQGVITDMDGKFVLPAAPGSHLVVSYIGYAPQEIVAHSGTVSVTLQENSKELNELVVVGFGTQKKVNLTGSVSVVSGEDLAQRPVTNTSQALQGMVPGLNISQSNGSLEDHPSVNVRGTGTIGQGTSGSPLVLIDGMEGDINTVNPQDIANISVLKDVAASSIYGSRAPFGVILITTKSGSKDGKVKINYNNSFRWSSPIRLKHMMNSVDFASWMNNSKVNNGEGLQFSLERMKAIQDYANATPVGPGTRRAADGTLLYSISSSNGSQWDDGYATAIDDVDWYNEIYKKRTFSQEHNFSATGGNDKFNYYTSFGYLDQGGLMKLGEEGLNRYNATGKINARLTSWLRFYYNFRFVREDYKRPATLTSSLYSDLARQGWPVLPILDRNGYYYSSPSPALGLATGGTDKKQSDDTYHQAGFQIEPIKNWITHIDFNYHIESDNRHWDKQQLYNHDVNGNPYLNDNSSNIHEDYYKENYYNFQAYTEYSRTFLEKHNFHIMAGFQAEDLKQLQFGLQRSGIMIPSKPEVDLGTGLGPDGKPVTPDTNGSRNEWTTVGFFGRFNYDYQGKYLLEVNVRRDGSSRFRKGNQWKTFPSFSLGWNMASEDFFKPLNHVIDQLKLRASYGTLGNQNTNNWYQTFQTLSASASAGSWLQNGVKPNIASAPGLVSETLTWEKIESWNLGVDFGFFNHRLTGSFDYFVRNTKNMVGNAPELPDILGTSVPVTNNTDLQTHGWELTLGWQDRLQNGLSYGATFNLSDSRTKITRYPNNPTNSISTYIPGRYINEIWGYETIGIAKTQEEMENHLKTTDQSAIGSNWGAGDIMYKDLNGDGKISAGAGTLADHGDQKVIGNSTPRLLFGLDMNASWKGFDVRVFFQGVMKRDFWVGGAYMFGADGGGQWWAAGITAVSDYFRDENSWSVKNGFQNANLDAYLPRPVYSSKNVQVQTRYLQNAAYIRLKNLQVGYTIPAEITRKMHIEKFRVFFSGDNLWTGTKMDKQFDPETVGTSGGNGYPLSSTLSCGINITF